MRDYNTSNKKSFIVIHDGLLSEISEAFIKLTGYSINELMGKSYLEVTNLLKFSRRSEFEHINKDFIMFLFTKSLEPREVVVSGERAKNLNDTIWFFSEIKNSRLKNKFQYFEQLYLDNSSRIAIYDASDLVLLKANQKYIDYLAKPFNKEENFIGQSLKKIIRDFKGSDAEKLWENTIVTGKTFYASEVMEESYNKTRTYWDLSIVPIYSDGKVKYLVENYVEVTERVLNRKLAKRQTISEVQNIENEAIINVVDEYISIFLKSGECIRLSKFLEDLFEVNEINEINNINELKDKINFFDIKGNRISFDESAFYLIIHGQEINDYKEIIQKGNIKKYVVMNGKPIFDKLGKFEMYVLMTHDITDVLESKAIEEQKCQLELLKSEAEDANNVKSLFLANISHEIRTPMNGILVTIQLLKATTVNIEQSKYIKMLNESSDLLLKIINDILDITKIKSGKFKLDIKPFSLKETVNNIYNNLLIKGNLKGLEVSYYLDPTADCRVIGDERRISQLLNNLVNNAVKFTEEGYISFRITRVSSDDECEKIKFIVKDTGIGIKESFKEKIFDDFNQGDESVSKKYGGVGVGLSISKQLAKLMDGELSFESEVGKGTIFCFICKMQRV